MNRVRSSVVATAAAVLFVSVQSAAQTVTVPAQPKATGKAQKQNDIICEKQEITGSRLASRRVCMTRASWAEKRLQERQDVEKVQVQRGLVDN